MHIFLLFLLTIHLVYLLVYLLLYLLVYLLIYLLCIHIVLDIQILTFKDFLKNICLNYT